MSDKPHVDEWEKKAEWLLRSLSPLILLRNLMIHRTAYPTDRFYRTYLDSRHLGDPGYHQSHDLLKYHDEARLLISWLERNPALAERIAELSAMGFDPSFGVYDEPWVSMLTFYIPLNPRAEARLRDEAKAAAGVRTKLESQEFDRRLDLYIKQGWAPDWREWRERFPRVEFP